MRLQRRWISCSLAIALGVLGGLGGRAPAADAAGVSIHVEVFYSRLAPYGRWIERPHYGRVWVPAGVPVTWRPYTHGHWVFTDDYGWLWVSDWDWGWASFHYGRWVYDDDYGWVWVPGTEWAPAWVLWRSGDGWVGWAPLPPSAVWRPSYGFAVQMVQIEQELPPPTWVFCPEREFLRQDLHSYVVMTARNVTIFSRTRNVTRYRIVKGRIVDRSLDVARLEKATGGRIVRHRVSEVGSPAGSGARTQGNEVFVYRPKPGAAPAAVRPSVHAAPRSVTSPERLRAEQETQRRKLQQEQSSQRQRLEQRYQRELGSTHSAPARGELRRQEQRELRVLQEQHSREQRLLQQRQQRELGSAAPKGPAGKGMQPGGKSRGHGKNR